MYLYMLFYMVAMEMVANKTLWKAGKPKTCIQVYIFLMQVKHNINPFRPEFTFVIFIHYKPRIAVAILDL